MSPQTHGPEVVAPERLTPVPGVKLLGAGRHGRVTQMLLDGGQRVALKRPLDGDAWAKDALLVEHDVLSSVAPHPHVVRCFGSVPGADGQPVALVLDVHETSMWSALKDADRGARFFPDMLTLLNVFHDLGRALRHLHKKGYIHGDLRPTNVLLSTSPRRGDLGTKTGTPKTSTFAVIADLGSAERVGTTIDEAYRAARSAFTHLSTDETMCQASDVFALGHLIVEAVVGMTLTDRRECQTLWQMGGASVFLRRASRLVGSCVTSLPPADVAMRLYRVVQACTCCVPCDRPTMNWVLRKLNLLRTRLVRDMESETTP